MEKPLKLEALVFDVSESIFEKHSTGLMYVVRDIYEAETTYVFTLSTHSFSIFIREDYVDKDTAQEFRYVNPLNANEKERLIKEIKRVIENWYELY